MRAEDITITVAPKNGKCTRPVIARLGEVEFRDNLDTNSATSRERFQRRLEAKFGKKIEASVSVDPEIIGGIKIIVGDTVIDASVKGQLQNLAYTLTA